MAMSHNCASLLCDTPHYACECNRCEDCHAYHVDEGMLLEMWGECPRCADDIAYDITRGIRCLHGNLIPDGYQTDIPCEFCEAFYELAA